jgi:hypothetical protein
MGSIENEKKMRKTNRQKGDLISPLKMVGCKNRQKCDFLSLEN